MKENPRGRVLLVTSSFEDLPWVPEGKTGEASTSYPIGLAYLHSYLESKNIETRMLPLNRKSFEYCFNRVIKEIEEFSPTIIGFQMITSNRVSSYRLIEYIHENYPKIKLVIGGIHTTIMYKQLIEKYPFLIAVLGEGERTLLN